MVVAVGGSLQTWLARRLEVDTLGPLAVDVVDDEDSGGDFGVLLLLLLPFNKFHFDVGTFNSWLFTFTPSLFLKRLNVWEFCGIMDRLNFGFCGDGLGDKSPFSFKIRIKHCSQNL